MFFFYALLFLSSSKGESERIKSMRRQCTFDSKGKVFLHQNKNIRQMYDVRDFEHSYLFTEKYIIISIRTQQLRLQVRKLKPNRVCDRTTHCILPASLLLLRADSGGGGTT